MPTLRSILTQYLNKGLGLTVIFYAQQFKWNG